MLTYEEIKNALLGNPSRKVAIHDGNMDIPIYGASTIGTNSTIFVAPYDGNQFAITENHTLKILS